MLSKLSVHKDKEWAGVVKRPSVIDHGTLIMAPIELKHGKRHVEANTLDEGSGGFAIITRGCKADGVCHP